MSQNICFMIFDNLMMHNLIVFVYSLCENNLIDYSCTYIKEFVYVWKLWHVYLPFQQKVESINVILEFMDSHGAYCFERTVPFQWFLSILIRLNGYGWIINADWNRTFPLYRNIIALTRVQINLLIFIVGFFVCDLVGTYQEIILCCLFNFSSET